LLRAQDRRFAGDCCIAGAVNALFAVRPDAELADGLQPLDDADQIPLARRLRPFPQPGERRTVFIVGNGKQRFQPCDRFREKTPTAAFLSQFGVESLRDLPDLERLQDAGLLGATNSGQEALRQFGPNHDYATASRA
jgi:hypothetical protein